MIHLISAQIVHLDKWAGICGFVARVDQCKFSFASTVAPLQCSWLLRNLELYANLYLFQLITLKPIPVKFQLSPPNFNWFSPRLNTFSPI
jgi:hypothetical protein